MWVCTHIELQMPCDSYAYVMASDRVLRRHAEARHLPME